MRMKIALVIAAALALTVPSAALAHKGDGVRKAVKHELREDAKNKVRHALTIDSTGCGTATVTADATRLSS